MSILTHWCTRCAHQVIWHEARARGYTSCRCCRAGDPAPGEPQVHSTFHEPGGTPEGLWPPGSTRNPGTMHATVTCDCQACVTAYARLCRCEESPPRAVVSA